MFIFYNHSQMRNTAVGLHYWWDKLDSDIYTQWNVIYLKKSKQIVINIVDLSCIFVK